MYKSTVYLVRTYPKPEAPNQCHKVTIKPPAVVGIFSPTAIWTRAACPRNNKAKTREMNRLSKQESSAVRAKTGNTWWGCEKRGKRLFLPSTNRTIGLPHFSRNIPKKIRS
jgi:hypothetical protein